jgi:cell division protein FtsQ
VALVSALAHAIGRVRPGARRGSRAFRDWRRPLAIAALAALLLALGYWFWFRDSGLVAVSKVEVEGIPAGSPGAAKLEGALERAGRQMTTLHVQPQLLERAASDFPVVRSINAEPDFPHTLSVRVVERRPAALIGSGSAAVVVADDGTVLRSLPAEGLELPRLPLSRPPKHRRLGGTGLDQALVLGAAPKALQPYLDRSYYRESGVVVELRGGIELRFGSPARGGRKWRAAAAVIADPSLTVLDYVDLSSPERPAVGGAGHVLPTAP